MIYKEIICKPDLPQQGKSVYRKAVRGIILDQHLVLMVYSDQNGDYKFPGRGVETGESDQQALIREIAEECGARVVTIGQAYAEINEIDSAVEPDIELLIVKHFQQLMIVPQPRVVIGFAATI